MKILKLQILPKVSLIVFITVLVIIINSAGWGLEAANFAFCFLYAGYVFFQTLI